MQFKSLLYLASFVTFTLGSTVQDVLNDLSVLQSSVETLDNAVKNFPNSGGTQAQMSEILSDSTGFQSAMDATTADTKAVTPEPVSEADGQTLVNAITVNVQIILDFLSNIVEKKPVFEDLPFWNADLSGLLLQDLRNLNASNVAKVDAFAAIFPADILDEAKPLISELTVAYTTAISTYESQY